MVDHKMCEMAQALADRQRERDAMLCEQVGAHELARLIRSGKELTPEQLERLRCQQWDAVLPGDGVAMTDMKAIEGLTVIVARCHEHVGDVPHCNATDIPDLIGERISRLEQANRSLLSTIQKRDATIRQLRRSARVASEQIVKALEPLDE